MNIALLHVRPGRGPVGVWRITAAGPQAAYYPDDPDGAAQNRAAVALAMKGDQVPWDVWARRLGERSPYLDDYRVITSSDGESLPDLLLWAIAVWDSTP